MCSAIWYKDQETPVYTVKNIDKGIVLCGFRHMNIVHQCVTLLGKSDYEMGDSVQGFLTSKNRFVDRKEALQIALAANQVKRIEDVRGTRLYSEDLY